MANPADEWSSADLKALTAGGLITEDVMAKIWDISRIPLPFTDIIGTDSHKNAYAEWTQDSLAAPDITNAVVDGADAVATDAAGGGRVGNHSQISQKAVSVTQRAQHSAVIGRANELSYQVMMRQQECKRDIEAIMLTQQASIADSGTSTPGKSGGFSSWLETNTSNGATGSDGGFNTSTKVVDAADGGNIRAFTEVMLKASVLKAYNANGNVTHIMSTPELIQKLNTFLLSSSANIATPTANVTGTSPVKQVAQGAVNVYATDFNTVLIIEPNRLQVNITGNEADVFYIDPTKVAISFLEGMNVKPLAKVGLADKRQMSADWTLKVYDEAAHAIDRGIDDSAAVTAS
ncbi:MAG: DUF5309 family protein [Acidiferrobacterales bacterium]